MIMFFDTETTGFPDYRMPPDHECQPYLVQMACLLMDDDGTERCCVSIIVNNPGIPIPPAASAVHGITDAITDRAGVFNPTAVALWDRMAERADIIVAHNIKFDMSIMDAAWSRVRSSKHPSLEVAHGKRVRFCTMEAATPILNMPPTSRMLAAGFNKPKPPKLEECIQYWFGESHDKAHDALADVRACARIYFHMKTLEQVVA